MRRRYKRATVAIGNRPTRRAGKEKRQKNARATTLKGTSLTGSMYTASIVASERRPVYFTRTADDDGKRR